MPKKVLFLTSTNVLQDGAAQCLMKLAGYLQSRGDLPWVVMPDEGAISDYYRSLGVPVRVIPYNRMTSKASWAYQLAFLPKFYQSIGKMSDLVQREAMDLVHVNEIIDFNGLIAARRAGVPSVCHVRAIVQKPRWIRSLLVGAVRRYADRVICVSQAVQQMMFEGRRISPERLRVIYDGGPDLSRFDPARVIPCSRVELGVPEAAFVVGLVSKMVRVKGHDQLLRAAARLRSQGHKDTFFVLVGGRLPGHEDYFDELQEMIRAEELEDRVIQLGYREDIPSLLAMFDVFVHLPTYEDPFPGVVLEAMAMERPVVAYDSGGIREQFEDGRSGVLLRKGDIEGLARTLVDLGQNPGRRAAMGKQAREYLLSKFSLDRHFQQVTQVYEELLHR